MFSENAILRDEVHSFEMVRVKMGDTITKLEEELKTVKQKLAEKEAEAEEVLYLCMPMVIQFLNSYFPGRSTVSAAKEIYTDGDAASSY